ncbi:uncharacterized protein HKW66_Vig0210000 [Vigna angularis]|uniref:Uncharacterized protein n=1 Tax=Phaseolus angularis TaxID=3914 RepID=A0A8T0JG19_PHAAN|nr:uncharacterized protein HKW66_Vig0210000 [Vigna angularis]
MLKNELFKRLKEEATATEKAGTAKMKKRLQRRYDRIPLLTLSLKQYTHESRKQQPLHPPSPFIAGVAIGSVAVVGVPCICVDLPPSSPPEDATVTATYVRRQRCHGDVNRAVVVLFFLATNTRCLPLSDRVVPPRTGEVTAAPRHVVTASATGKELHPSRFSSKLPDQNATEER